MSDTDVTPGPAVDCEFGCGTISAVDEKTIEIGNSDCPSCGEHGVLIRIVACGKGAECDDDEHHFGTGFHHVEQT